MNASVRLANPALRPVLTLAALLLVLGGASGCVSHSTSENEVGVLVCKLGVGCEGKGVQQIVYPPGSTNLFAPFIRDFFTFDTKLQNLEMVANGTRGDRQHSDDLQFKTTDGNDISMDVTLAWQIDPKQAPNLLQNVGNSTDEIKEKLVRPMARTLVRDVLNELDSEAIYNSDKRFEKAEKAKQVLIAVLAPFGVMVQQVILHEHRFNPEYEKVIRERKLAEQRAEQIKSEAEAGAQEAIRNLETARGKVAADIEAAKGRLSEMKLSSDATYYAQQQDAEALLAERTNKAKGIAKRNEALRGIGGRAMVKLKIAEALQGKTIALVPVGQAGSTLNRLDLNQLIERVRVETQAKPAAE